MVTMSEEALRTDCKILVLMEECIRQMEILSIIFSICLFRRTNEIYGGQSVLDFINPDAIIMVMLPGGRQGIGISEWWKSFLTFRMLQFIWPSDAYNYEGSSLLGGHLCQLFIMETGSNGSNTFYNKKKRLLLLIGRRMTGCLSAV